MKNLTLENGNFAPVFLVGAPRSGTTMLAVLLDRHSNIAMPPETQFYSKFVPEFEGNIQDKSSEEIVNSALEFHRIKDLKLENEIVLSCFRKYGKTFPSLLRAILETYALKQGKLHPGEKSPRHLEHAQTILNSYPLAKIVCILRDGRDMVQSMLKVPWTDSENPRSLGKYCVRWTDYCQLAIKFVRQYPTRFILVKYENILINPEEELKKLCEFIGEKFEPTQLNPDFNSAVVPDWENNWKKKALLGLDPKRIEAWRKINDKNQIWFMNSMMGSMLKHMGYVDADMQGCPWHLRFLLAVRKIPYLRPLRHVSLLMLRIIRWITGIRSYTNLYKNRNR